MATGKAYVSTNGDIHEVFLYSLGFVAAIK